MTDEERKHVYLTLLRGLASEAQDQLCAADKQHAWSPWHRTQLRRDGPLRGTTTPDQMNVAMNETFHIKRERRCLNCGKEQVE